jgi:hypothetical protein
MSGMNKVKIKGIELTSEQAEFCNGIAEFYQISVVSKRQINEYVKANKLPYPKFIFTKKFEEGFGKYRVAADEDTVSQKDDTLATVTPISEAVQKVLASNIEGSLIPEKDPLYVPFGFYNKLKKIIESKIFYPVYITGLSGNGKTLMVEQVCANIGREYIRVNITKDTDEFDLIGSSDLVDGNTVPREGPVITAMRRGAILLLDETDLGTERLLCLQPILEGKPYFNKRTGEVVHPVEGFNIMATANTKGKGSEDGRFIGTNTLNEAFLERFAITVEQEYPDAKAERNILARLFNSLSIDDAPFIDILIDWAGNIRKLFADGGIDEIISTRRLTHITKAYSIFEDRQIAVELCLNRFDTETKRSFLDLYNKFDDGINVAATVSSTSQSPDDFATILKNASAKTKATTTPVAGGPPSINAVAPSSSNNSTFNIPAAVKPDSNRFATKAKVPSPAQLPKFASPKTLFEVSTKYNTIVSVTYDEVTSDYVVSSHGKESRISNNAISSFAEKNEGQFLDLLVGANKAKADHNSGINQDYRPIV